MRAGCVKGKGTAAEELLKAEEAALEATEVALAAEDTAEAKEDDVEPETPDEGAREAVEEATEDAFDAAKNAEEEEAVFVALPGGVFWAALLISCNFCTVFGTVPTAFANSVSGPLWAEIESAIATDSNVKMIIFLLMKPVFKLSPLLRFIPINDLVLVHQTK